jgi:hypothetical protein
MSRGDGESLAPGIEKRELARRQKVRYQLGGRTGYNRETVSGLS